MNQMVWVGGLLLAGCVAGAYLAYKGLLRNSEPDCPVQSEELEGVLSLADVKDTFDTWKIEKQKHMPFLARKSYFDGSKKGYQLKFKPGCEELNTVVIGVFDKEDDQIRYLKIVYASGISRDIEAIMKQEDLVVLE